MNKEKEFVLNNLSKRTTVNEIKILLKKYNLPLYGNRDTLISRLIDYLNN